MTLLHNQTCEKIEWTGAGRTFKWLPYGSTEIPAEMVAPLRAQRFPVSEVPVTPERKAAAIAADEEAKIRGDEVTRLKRDLMLVTADATAALEEVKAAEGRRAASELDATEAKAKARALESDLASARGDLKAAEDLIRELTQRLEDKKLAPKPKSEAKSASA